MATANLNFIPVPLPKPTGADPTTETGKLERAFQEWATKVVLALQKGTVTVPDSTTTTVAAAAASPTSAAAMAAAATPGPAQPTPPAGTAGGDLDGTYPNPRVVKINGQVPGNIITKNIAEILAMLSGGPAGGDLSGNYPDPILRALSAVLADTLTAGTTNDYSPADLSVSNVLQLTPSSANRQLSGIDKSVFAMANPVLVIENLSTVATDYIVLLHQDAGSAAANRFSLPHNRDVAIPGGGAVVLHYDATNSFWRVLSTQDFIPSGIIAMWSGALANIPDGWFLCDGTNGTPDLSDRFILGTTVDADIGDTGGATQHKHAAGTLVNDSVSAGTPSGSIDDLISDAHTTTSVQSGVGTVVLTGPSVHDVSQAHGGTNSFHGVALPGHTHTISGKTADAENGAGSTASEDIYPPWFKLAFIMKG